MTESQILARRYRQERRMLQGVVGAVVIFPLLLGAIVAGCGLAAMGPLFGAPVPRPFDPTLDSSVRFLGANFFGMGLLVLWVLPNIETRLAPFRIFVATGLLGAAARILSIMAVGRPVATVEALIGVEVSLLMLALWQTRVHRMYVSLGKGTAE